MLQELRIKNFVLVEELTINFTKGLNILTGETGAGKSILIDALSAVLGEKMNTSLIRSGCERAIIEGVFEIKNLPQVTEILNNSGIDSEDEMLFLRRELYLTGRGRCFANSSQIPVAKMKEIADYLVDIHGQHEHQNIMNISRHRETLDNFANTQDKVLEIREIYNQLHDLKEKINSFQFDEKEKTRKIEFLNFAINEIAEANLKPGEEEKLKDEANLLSNAEKMFKDIHTSVQLFKKDGGVLNSLEKIENNLSGIVEYDSQLSESLESTREALYSLDDVANLLRNYKDTINFTPERINEVESRIALISSLKKKYGDSIQEILDYATKSEKELQTINSSDEQIEELKNTYKKTVKLAKEKALTLSQERQEAAQRLEKMVMQELTELNMAGTQFKIAISQENNPQGEIEEGNNIYVLYPSGIDKIEFLLAANKGQQLQQLRKVASGGEMSRIMLALKKSILAADIVETLIFDEVDTGIGGSTANVVGKKLKELSHNRQVLLITHLAQIAAMSDNHFFVQKSTIKDKTTSSIKQLNKDEKIYEIARMMGGAPKSTASLNHAKELIEFGEGIK